MLSLRYLTSSLRMRKSISLFDMESPMSSVDCLANNAASVAESGGELATTGPSHHQHHQHQHQHHQMASFYRTSKWLCYLTTCLAFMLGVGVGIALPILYASPSYSTLSSTFSYSPSALSSSSSSSLIVDQQVDNLLPIATNVAALQSSNNQETVTTSRTSSNQNKIDWRKNKEMTRRRMNQTSIQSSSARRLLLKQQQQQQQQQQQHQERNELKQDQQREESSENGATTSEMTTVDVVSFIQPQRLDIDVEVAVDVDSDAVSGAASDADDVNADANANAGIEAKAKAEAEAEADGNTNANGKEANQGEPRANNNTIPSQEQSEAVDDGIFWSSAVEQIVPKGFDQQDAKEWRDFSHAAKIERIQEGCGRMQNRLVTFEKGRQSCARYRQNYDQIQGEIFSFYTSQLLGLRNLPPSSLGLVRPRHSQWNNLQVQSSINQAQWTEDRPIVYTQFLDQLEPAYIPVELRGRNRHLNPSDVERHRLDNKADRDELITLAQWSDLLVFDYLTANLDRMVNNLYNMQWNPAMMDSPAHNLARHSQTGLLVFLDNESGLLHGYRLLDKYETYHKSLLESLCLFRRSTVQALQRLQADNNIGALLRRMFETRDGQLVDFLPFLPEKSIKTLNYRIDQVLEQVNRCQSIYRSS